MSTNLLVPCANSFVGDIIGTYAYMVSHSTKILSSTGYAWTYFIIGSFPAIVMH